MILLFVAALLLQSSNADFGNTLRSHLSENLKLKCDSLPYRTAVVGARCYFAVYQQVFHRETHKLCSSTLKGAKVELNDAGVLRKMMVNQSTFHTDADTSGGKHALCSYEIGYKCEEGQTMLRGKCFARVNKKMTFVEAQRNCKKQGLELPSLGNDLENRIFAGELADDPAWVQNYLVRRGNKNVWTSNYARYSTCDGSTRKPPLYTGGQKAGCKVPVASVIEKNGMAVYCIKPAESELSLPAPKKVLIEGDGPCATHHELDESTGECEWTGPDDACAQLIDFWNNTYFIRMEKYPEMVHTEECLITNLNPINDQVVKVVVRRGCMFTGYAYEKGNVNNQEIKVGPENLGYGTHKLPNFITGEYPDVWRGLSRVNCFCDRTEATINGHVPAPPPDRKCIEHHKFNETTQQCEWTQPLKFCAELHAKDNRRMFLEMPNWPTGKKYDVDHYHTQHHLNYHMTWRTLPTQGYGFYQVAALSHGTKRFVVIRSEIREEMRNEDAFNDLWGGKIRVAHAQPIISPQIITSLVLDNRGKIWRHGLRTPIQTYANDPYNETFFGMPDGELLPHGMEQHFIRGQQLRKLYVEEHKLVSPKYSRYETYVRSADFARCSQSALANLAGFYADSPTFPAGVSNWPSSWTPIPIHTVPHDEDHVLEGFDRICPKLSKLENDRMNRPEFQDFVASQWRTLHTINTNSGNPVDYSWMALAGMYQDLSIEKDCNLTLPDWVTDEFYSDLEEAMFESSDYTIGQAGFGLPMDPEMVKLNAGFLFKDWMDNIDAVINGTTTLKYYAYSGHDVMMNAILIGLGVKQELAGPSNSDYASTIICEVWEKDGQYFVKLIYSKNIDSRFEPFTGKLPGCGSDLCSLSDFKQFMQPFMADDVKICDAKL